MVVEKCLMSLAMVQETQVQMTSSCTFQRRAPPIILNLVKQYQGKLSGSEKKVKIPDMLVKSDSPPLGIFGDMNTE